MARTAFATILLLGLLAGTILLQLFLSKRESKWPGLVLPAITFLYSVLMVLNLAALGDTQGMVVTMMTILITGNIPTLILLAVYTTCRGGKKKQREMDKMNINDL